MKKIFILSVLLCSISIFQNCSNSDNENEIEIVNDFTNADYIKSKMIGKWNYWGHKSPSCNCWAYNGDIYKGYFTFTNDNKYTFKDEVTGELQNGSFTIYPATKTDNASLSLNYQLSGQTKYRFITLKDLKDNQAITFESAYDKRYDKE